MKKKLFSLALALALCMGLTVPAFAAELILTAEDSYSYDKYVNFKVGDFHEGLASIGVDEGQVVYQYGYIDKTKQIVIPIKYDEAGDFSQGLAAVKLNGKWGFINQTGEVVVPLQYDNASSFRAGIAAVKRNSKWGFIDKDGKEIIPCIYDEAGDFSAGLAAVKLNGKWGFINQANEEIIPCTYDEAKGFSEGLATVKQSSKWGFIDQTGKVVVPCKYDETGKFSEGLAAVKLNGKWGFIDQTGEMAIPCKYDDMHYLSWQFESVGYFSEGLAPVALNDKYGYIDKSGKEVIPCIYAAVLPFSSGFAAVAPSYGMLPVYGYINKTGKKVVRTGTTSNNGVNYSYYVASSFSEGVANVKRRFLGGKDENFLNNGFFTLTVDANVSDWAREQVDSAAANGLMPDGLGDDFTVNITRAEFAALTVKLYEAMSGQTAPAPGDSPFSDTNDPVVIQAEALGIVGGVGDGKFAPSNPVTRQEAALMLSRVYTKLGGEIPKVEATTFADNGDVASWAIDAVAFMSDQKIVNGVGSNNFNPKGNASIEQAMVIALHMFENLK